MDKRPRPSDAGHRTQAVLAVMNLYDNEPGNDILAIWDDAWKSKARGTVKERNRSAWMYALAAECRSVKILMDAIDG